MTPSSGKSRVWIVEDQRTFRHLLAEYLASLPSVEVAGSSPDHAELMTAVAARRVDVVILDLELEHVGGLAILRALGAVPEAPAAIILTANASEHSVFMAAHLGVRGFLEKNDPLETIGRAILRVAEGGLFFSNGPRRLLGNSVMHRWARLDADELSKREIGLLVALTNDLPIKEAAEKLNLSVWSTYKLRTSLKRKTTAQSDVDLLHYARRIGLTGTRLAP